LCSTFLRTILLLRILTFYVGLSFFAALINQLAEKHNLQLKSSYNVSRGFHIQLPSKDAVNMPEDFIKVKRSAWCIYHSIS